MPNKNPTVKAAKTTMMVEQSKMTKQNNDPANNRVAITKSVIVAGLILTFPLHFVLSLPVLAETNPANAAAIVQKAEPDNLEISLRELHESLRRMKGAVDDILHEVTRTQEVFNNGVPVSSNPWAQNPNYLMNGGMVAQDALSHAVYLPPRAHWLNNSLTQLQDLEGKLQIETGNITKILSSPKCNSATRSQGMVLGDITTELGQDLKALQAVASETPPSNAKINVNAHKIVETISGMDKVGDRLWKEAPRGLKDN